MATIGKNICATWQALLGSLEQYMTHRALASHTQTAYSSDIKEFLCFLEHHEGWRALEDLSKLHPKILRRFFAQYTTKNKIISNNKLPIEPKMLCPRSRKRRMSALRFFFTFCRECVQIHVPQLSLRLPTLAQTLPRPMTFDQIEALCQTYRHHDCWQKAQYLAIFLLLYSCGLRIAELLSITLRDWVDSTSGQSHQAIDSNNQNAKLLMVVGKRHKQRYVPILPIAYEAVETYRALCSFEESPERALFLSVTGKPLYAGRVQQEMRQWRTQHGLQESITPHALRHSFASHLFQSGANLRHIQELLGHASLASTQVYTQVETDELLRTCENFHPRFQKSNDDSA